MPMSTCQLTVVCDTSRPLLLTPPNPSPTYLKDLSLLAPTEVSTREFLPEGREDKASECRVGLLVALTHVEHAR